MAGNFGLSAIRNRVLANVKQEDRHQNLETGQKSDMTITEFSSGQNGIINMLKDTRESADKINAANSKTMEKDEEEQEK